MVPIPPIHIIELDQFGLMGNIESLILLFNAAVARFARILRSSIVGAKEHFFAEIVKPRKFSHFLRALLI